jgi:putative transcriptional regulator
MAPVMSERVRPNRVKERRKASGITALQLAQQIGVREATLYRYESGDLPTPLHIAQKLAQILDSTLDELFPVPAEEARA